MKPAGLLTGPNASGTIGDTLTYAKIKGQSTVKNKPIPTYRDTTKQHDQRSDHSDCVELWQVGAGFDSADKLAYNKAASRDPRPISGFNKFMSLYRLPFGSVLVRQLFSVVDATVAAPNLVITGTATKNTVSRIVFYDNAGVYVYEKAFTPAMLAFTISVATALLPASGYFRLYKNNVTDVGQSGIYPFPT